MADGAPSCPSTTSAAAADPTAAAGPPATLLLLPPLLNEGTTFTYAANEQNATMTNIVDNIMTRARERRPLPFANMAFALLCFALLCFKSSMIWTAEENFADMASPRATHFI